MILAQHTQLVELSGPTPRFMNLLKVAYRAGYPGLTSREGYQQGPGVAADTAPAHLAEQG